jgi:pantothenate kinase
MEETYENLAREILKRSKDRQAKRYLVAIAGTPGSGKTTTAKHVTDLINSWSSRGLGTLHAVCVPMDGFHLPRSMLDRLPDPVEAYIRRGAPWTFDVSGVLELVHLLRESKKAAVGPKQTILAPSFDHALKDPVDDGIIIPPSADIILLEGNYLLLDEEGWRDIADLVDLRIFIDVDLKVARDRVAERHVKSGIETSLEDAYRRVDANDFLNGSLIMKKMRKPDIVIRSVSEKDLPG